MGRIKNFFRDCYTSAHEFSADDANTLAASVAYYAALSFFPLLLILISGMGLFLRYTNTGQDAEQQVVTFIAEQASPQLAAHVQEAFHQLGERAGTNGPIGLALLVFTAMLIFTQFETAFDRIWNTPHVNGGGIVRMILDILFYRLRAFLMILCLGGLLIAVFIAGLVLTAVETYAEGYIPLTKQYWWVIQSAFTIGLNALVFALVFRFLPKRPVRWGDALRGGILTSIVWEVGRLLLASFVIGGKYSSAYGVVGSFIAIMLWIYYAVAMLFFGAEYVQVSSGEPKHSAPPS